MLLRQPFCLIIAIFLCALGLSSVAEGQYDLTRPIPGRAYRSSTADPDWTHGNGDYRPRIPQYTIIEDALGTYVNSFLVGKEATAQGALDKAQAQIEKNWK